MIARFLLDAQAELDIEADRYEARQIGLGVEFRREVEDAVADILAHPAASARYGRTPCRQCILPKFPFSLIYREYPAFIRIIALAHHSRRPGYWKGRLRYP